MSNANPVAPRRATLAELGLTDVPFPEGFKANYYAMDAAEDYAGCAYVHEQLPIFDNGEWISDGDRYELGVHEIGDTEFLPAICHGLNPENSLFEIVG